MKKLLFVAVAALPLMLVACGDKKAKQATDADSTAVENRDTAEAVVDDGFQIRNEDLHQLPIIARRWASKPLKGITAKATTNDDGCYVAEKKADIEGFAYAFCKEYAEYAPNGFLRNFLEDPGMASEEESLFLVHFNKADGYVSSMLQTEYGWDTYGCYWNRKNGHKLVAFYMSEFLENYDEGDQLLVFYDYDPATDTMTPEPAIAKKLEEAMAKYDDYSVTLPEKGKDIAVMGLNEDPELDNYTSTDYILRWNGNDFNLELDKNQE